MSTIIGLVSTFRLPKDQNHQATSRPKIGLPHPTTMKTSKTPSSSAKVLTSLSHKKVYYSTPVIKRTIHYPKEPCLIHKQAPMSWQKRKAHGKLMQINHIANIDMKQLRQETLLRKYVCHICLRQMRLINKQLCKITTGKTQKCKYVKTAQKKKKKLVHLLQIAQ